MPNYRAPRKATNTVKPKAKQSMPILTFIKYGVIIGIACLLAGYFGLKVYLGSLKPIKNLSEFKPNIVTKIYSSDGEMIKTFTGYKYQNVEFKDIPDNLKKAIIATEDKNFYNHHGYDPTGLARSMISNIIAGRLVQGASTITQQLARILFLGNEKTYNRKVKEFIISARIEKSLSKDKILEMYLNNIYLGSSAYGVAAAAQIYFDKSLKDLTLAECALIAGLPQAPSVYSPFNKADLSIKRRNHVLNRMYKMKYITKEQYDNALDEKLKLNANPEINAFNRAGYFVDYVIDELETLGFTEQEISQGGYKITTTLNYKAQQAAEEAVRKNLAAYGLTQDKQQAAAFSFNPNTGEIYVYVGGKNYGKSQYDRVRYAVRPPGSAFKPFVYAAAIEKGHDPNEWVDDSAIKVEGTEWAPKNYGNKYRGKIPLFLGLTISSNVVAVKLIQDVGVRPVINICRALGITTPIEHDYTIALGSNGVKLYELVIAYGAFANDGFKVRPYSVEQIETSRGQVIYKAPKKHSLKVLDSRTAAVLTAMLKTVITNGTGRAADLGKPLAAKSGTTDSYKDAWFVGYSPDVATGVWVGNDDNTNMRVALTGGSVPALIWRDIMKIVTAPYGNVDFNYPEIILKREGMPTKASEGGDDSADNEQPATTNTTDGENTGTTEGGTGESNLAPVPPIPTPGIIGTDAATTAPVAPLPSPPVALPAPSLPKPMPATP